MRVPVTTVLTMLLVFLLVGEATAQQDVTIREINAFTQASLDALNAAGADLVATDIAGECGGLIYINTLCNVDVRFTAVVMSDPLNSGLASASNGSVGRIHIFVRDVASDTEGVAGMGIQIVDGSNAFGLEGVLKGDVIEVVGQVDPFFSTMQISPTSITVVGARALSDPIFAPILVTTSDVNKSVGDDGAIQVNWDNLADLRGSLVRLENATVLQRTLGDRVDWNFTSDGGVTSISMYDTSIRYRNDKDDYPSNFNRRTSDFEPPPPGSTINIEGFLTYNGATSSDPFSLGVPNGQVLAINPMADSDLEVTEAPINATNVVRPTSVPGAGTSQFSVDFVVDPARSLTSTLMLYTTTSNSTATTLTSAFSAGQTRTFEMPQLTDGDFVTYWFTGEDSGGGTAESDKFTFRVLYGGITDIAHIQQTSDGKDGGGPFNGWTIETDLTVTLQTDPGGTGMSFVQDGTGPWSGVFVYRNGLEGNSRGDVIHITKARIQESFGLTRIRDLTYTVVSTGGDPLGYVDLANVDYTSDAIEPFEGMLVRGENSIVTMTNADDPYGPYGEFQVSNEAGTKFIRVDDMSDLVDYTDGDPGTVFSVGEKLEFVQGPLYYSFSNYKIVPETLTRDVGAVTNVATEADDLPLTFALEQNFPNPFNPTTSISYEIPTAGLVTLDVYDTLGRRVRSLVNREQFAGSHQITFDAGSLASGVYLYRLTAGTKVTSRTLILLK